MEIESTKCETCEQVIVPPRNVCPYCGPDTTLTNVYLQSEGTILSYTSLQRPPEGFEPPVVLALVELVGGGSILCLGKKEELDDVAIGKRVKLSKDSQERFTFSLL
ncbi:MAG: Zn-ribbon domain-containing OB-fold protein [Candidatus Thorarchaeota archaeon]